MLHDAICILSDAYLTIIVLYAYPSEVYQKVVTVKVTTFSLVRCHVNEERNLFRRDDITGLIYHLLAIDDVHATLLRLKDATTLEIVDYVLTGVYGYIVDAGGAVLVLLPYQAYCY